MSGRVLTGATGRIEAAHRGPDGEIHGHTWNVRAKFENRHRTDVRIYQAMLDALLATWDHKLLPEEVSWAEDIACAVGTLVNCVQVKVWRENGFHAWWEA